MTDIYQGDSFEILPTLLNLSVNLVITDPPYDLAEDQKVNLQNQFLRLVKDTIIVFSPPENQWLLPADEILFWVKPTSTKNTSRRYSRFVEMIFMYHPYGRSLTWNDHRHWSQYTNIFTDLVDDNRLHPFRKPRSLIERLIQNHSKPGDTILDPFCGSGVVGEVAMLLGRNFIGIEKDSHYYKLATDRIINLHKRLAEECED